LVGADFFVHFVAENVLVTEEVLNFRLINGHPLGVSVVHSLALVSVPVFESVVFFFRDLCQLGLPAAADDVIDQQLILRLVLDHMHETALLKGGEQRELGHQLAELFFAFLKVLKLCLRLKVHDLNHLFEFS
jgi:hypothetical protein